MARTLKCSKIPTTELSLTNLIYSHPNDFDYSKNEKLHLEVAVEGKRFILTASGNSRVVPGEMCFSALQRKWLNLTLMQEFGARPVPANTLLYAASVVLEVDLVAKKAATQPENLDTELMAREFTMQFVHQTVTVGQLFAFNFDGRKTDKVYQLLVKEIEGISPQALAAASAAKSPALSKISTGILFPNTVVSFDKANDAPVLLTGRCKGKNAYVPIINPNWDFEQLGVGGLDNEFSTVFRRAFASRVFPPEVVQQLGMKHVRGVLLFGPPGTGKTLMARQIAKMLNARQPKIVSGPEVLDKYVGESEANIRKLFAEAEEEEKRMTINSGLHIIIFDEIDAICKQRGSLQGAGGGVHDTVVNQLLAKMDGVDQLNNVLIIGMTNRKDMIDEALLRPGRFEVQMEIGLPDEPGRLQILKIHTAKLQRNKKLAPDVNLPELANITKNFSGAEIEGLCRAATTIAMNRHIKAIPRIEVDPEAVEKLLVTRADFMNAFQNDVKPAFGTRQEDIDVFIKGGIIHWGPAVDELIKELQLFANNLRTSRNTNLVSVLLEGQQQTGKTALAAWIAKKCEFPFTKFVSPSNMVGFSETSKCLTIKKVFDDAYKSPLSCVVLDDLEFMMDYSPVGPRYSNLVLQALLVYLKNLPPANRKLLLICTTAEREALEMFRLLRSFSSVLHVPTLSEPKHLAAALSELGGLPAMPKAHTELAKRTEQKKISVGIKKFKFMVEMARQTESAAAAAGGIDGGDEGNPLEQLVALMEQEGCLYAPSSAL